MDDHAGLLCLAKLLLEMLDLPELFGVILALRAVGDVNVSCDVVSDEATGSGVCDTGEVIKGLILGVSLTSGAFGAAAADLAKPFAGLTLETSLMKFFEDLNSMRSPFPRRRDPDT